MTKTPMTEDEWADNREHHARMSAVIALIICSGMSVAGCWYYAIRYGAGTLAAAVCTVSVTVVLILAIHLRGAIAAARAVERVHPGAHHLASIGGAVLVLMTLVANFDTLHALALAQRMSPVASLIAPLAPDVGIVVATAAIFMLKPRTRTTGKRASPPTREQRAPAAPPTRLAGADTSHAHVRTAMASGNTLRAQDTRTPSRTGEGASMHPSGPDAAQDAHPVEPTDAHHARARALVAARATAADARNVAHALALTDAGSPRTEVTRVTGIQRDAIRRLLARDAELRTEAEHPEQHPAAERMLAPVG